VPTPPEPGWPAALEPPVPETLVAVLDAQPIATATASVKQRGTTCRLTDVRLGMSIYELLRAAVAILQRIYWGTIASTATGPGPRLMMLMVCLPEAMPVTWATICCACRGPVLDRSAIALDWPSI